ncbi:MAG TPA: HAD-IIIA family hydrolase [Rhodocyclaceae bacterium]
MARRFELIVFDWDGTLMDSAAMIVSSIQLAAVDMGLKSPAESRARYVIGLGLEEALRHVLPELAEHRYGELVDRYRHHYLTRDHQLTLFDGAEALVRELHGEGRMLAVATGKSRIGLERALEASGLGPLFHATRCADECHSKPHPQMLEELMDEFGVLPETTLMIGDTSHDLQMATNAGVAAVGVSYGAHDRDGLDAHGALYCADTVEDLRQWLKSNA